MTAINRIKQSKIFHQKNFPLIYFVFVAITVFFSVMRPDTFLTINNFFTVARQVSMLGIAAVGMTFVIIVGGFDLSVGSLQGLVGVLVGSFMVSYHLPIPIAIILTLVLGAGVGFFNGTIITRLNVNPFITTLGMMTIIKGVAFAYTNAAPVYGFNKSFSTIGRGYIFNIIPIPVIIMLIVFLVGMIFMNRTYLGRYFYSVGGNEESSRLSGINTKQVKLWAYVLCSVLATLSGIILASRLNSGQPAAGVGFEFDVITACVLGGVSLNGGEGRLSGVLVGVLIIGILGNGMILLGIDEYYQWMIKGLVLISAVSIDKLKKSNL
jgi:ribose transport system permease protein